MASLLDRIKRQFDSNDGGANFFNPTPQQKAPQQAPVKQAPARTPAPVVQNRPTQASRATTSVRMPSYGSNPFTSSVNRLRDVFDANTPQDYAKRTAAAQPQISQIQSSPNISQDRKQTLVKDLTSYKPKFNPVTETAKSYAKASTDITKGIVGSAVNTVQLPVSAVRLGVANATNNRQAANKARTALGNDAKNNFLWNEGFNKTADIFSGAITANSQANASKRANENYANTISKAYGDTPQAKAWAASNIAANTQADDAERLGKYGLTPTSSLGNTINRVGLPIASTGAQIALNAVGGGAGARTATEATKQLAKQGTNQVIRQAINKTGKQALGFGAANAGIGVADTLANGGSASDALKAGATSFAVGAAMPIGGAALGMGVKPVTRYARNAAAKMRAEYQYTHQLNKNNHPVTNIAENSARRIKKSSDYAPNIPNKTPVVNPIRGLDRFKMNQKGAIGKASDPLEALKAEASQTWYHGTNAKFDKFDQSKIGSTTDDGLYGRGFYFSNDKSFAQQAPKGGAKNVMEVQPNVTNPLDLSKFKTKEELADYLDMSPDALVKDEGRFVRPINSQINQFTSHVQEKGHDGVLAPHSRLGARGDELVAFDAGKINQSSGQAKSSTATLTSLPSNSNKGGRIVGESVHDSLKDVPLSRNNPIIPPTQPTPPVQTALAPVKTKPITQKAPPTFETTAAMQPPDGTLTKTGGDMTPPNGGNLELAPGKQKKTQYASKTIPESEFVSQPIKEATEKGAPLYTPETERGGATNAIKRLKSEGDEQFGYKVSQSLDKKEGTISRQEAIDAQVYAAKLEQAGDDINISKASDIYDKLSAHYTKAGQLIQAAAMMSRRSPAGMKNYANKQFSKAGVKVTPKIQAQVDTAIAKLAKTKPGTDANALAMDEVLHTIAKNIPASKADLFINTWRANLLTAPTTTLGGFVGGVDTFINRKLWTNPVATIVDMAASLFTGKRSMTMAGGFGSGASKGVKTGLSKQYWQTGYDEIDGIAKGGKYDQPRDINFGDSKGGRVMGKYVNGVYRTMGLVDKPWKYGAQKEALKSMAKAEGLNKGYKGNQLKQYVNEFIDNPPEDVLNKANAEGKYAVFQDQTALGEIASAPSKYLRNKGMNGAAAIVDFIVPFKQIPSSIATRLIKRTPVGTAQNIVKQIIDVKKGGQFDQRAFSQATAEGFSGVPIIAAGYALSQGGLVTGGYPSDDKERKLWQAEGKQPNSVKVGNRWYSLNYIQPFGALLNIGAGASQADKDGKNGMDLVWAGLATGGKSVSEMSFLQGVSGVIDAAKNPGYASERLIQNTASSTVPNFVRSFANASDKYERQASGIKEGIQSAIPGWRQQLPAKKDAFGNDVKTKDNFVNRFVNPLKPSIAKGDESVAELRRLQDSELGIMPSEANSNVFSKTEKLDKKQLADLNGSMARKVSEAWNGLMKTEDYKAMSDEDKKKTLASAKKDYAAVAKAEWAAQNNKINDEWQPNLTAKQKAIASGNAPDYVNAGLPKNLPTSAKKTITEADGLEGDNKTTWLAKENTDKSIRESLKGWNNGQDLPKITNATAKDWADYQKDFAEGKINQLEAVKKKKTIIGKAYKSGLDDISQTFYQLGDDDMKAELAKGTISKEQMDKIIETDNKLTELGIQKYAQVGKKLRSALGYGAAPSKTASSGGSKSTKKSSAKTGRAKINLSDLGKYKLSDTYKLKSGYEKRLRDILYAARR